MAIRRTEPKAMPGKRSFKQKRSAETHESLLDAAERVFARRGFDAAQTPEIAAEAGVSTGAFYRYFVDKRACFVEMIARSLQRAHDDVVARLDPVWFAGAEARDAIDRAVEVLFTHVRRDAELERVYLAMSLRDPEVEQLRADFESKGLDALEALIASIVPREVVAHPRAAAHVIMVASIEIAIERAGMRPRSGPPLPDEQVRSALAEMIHRYLQLGTKRATKPKRR